MSNIFIRDINGVGGSVFAVPTSDAELAAATVALNAIVTTVPTLAYPNLLAWVETADGGAASRTLNALVQNFEYNAEECPDASEVNTMTAAIKALLEADPNINSIGSQQVSLYQVSGVQPISRDPSGFVYPTEATDEFYIGGTTPNGVWFDDGDMVLGASSMFGTERLRVVGNIRLESELLMPTSGIGTAVLCGQPAQIFGEAIGATLDTALGSGVGVLSRLNDTNLLPGVSFVGVRSSLIAAASFSGTFKGFEVQAVGGAPGWTQVGFSYPDMTGIALQGSFGFRQEGVNEVNEFIGRTGIGVSFASSTSLKVGVPTPGAAASWVSIKTDRSPTLFTGAPNWDHIRMDWAVVNSVGQAAGQVRYLAITSPISSQSITVSSCYGLYIDNLQADASLLYASTPYGIYQAGSGEINYFAGKVGIGSGKSVPTVDLDVAGNIRCDGAYQAGALAGASGTFTTTDLKTVTVTNGIITSIV